MPHIIVDGYNIIRRAPRFLFAEQEGLESGRYALLLELEQYSALYGYRVTVVFDGGGRPPHLGPSVSRSERFAGIDIIFSDRGESADEAIIRLIKEQKEERKTGGRACDDGEIVITDDFDLRDEAIENGAFVKFTDELLEAMKEKRRLAF
ncbi:MAG: NYN domain-containing protein [bacterium]